MTLRELLSRREAWTKHAYARNAYGTPVRPDSKEAVSFCLVAAYELCHPEICRSGPLWAAVQKVSGMEMGPMGFNDNHATTYQHVLAVIDILEPTAS